MAAVPESVPWLRDARRSALGQVLGGRPWPTPEKASQSRRTRSPPKGVGPCGPFCAQSHGDWSEDKEPAGSAPGREGRLRGGAEERGAAVTPTGQTGSSPRRNRGTSAGESRDSVRRARGSAGPASGPRIPAAVLYLASCFSGWDTIGSFKFNAEEPAALFEPQKQGVCRGLPLVNVWVPNAVSPATHF